MATVMQTQYDPASTMQVMRQLLESGVHFGHQTKRWNPKMKPYIFSERNGIHIIDLQQTAESMRRAQDFVTSITAHGGKILFVGTKKQAQEIIAEEASRAGMNYVNRRWMGGLLTNFVTIRSRLRRLGEIEEMENSGAILALPKKEQTSIGAEKEKLEKTIGGMRGMTRLPEAVFIVDPRREDLAVKEARRLEIPIIAWWTRTPTPMSSITSSLPTTTRSAPSAYSPRRWRTPPSKGAASITPPPPAATSRASRNTSSTPRTWTPRWLRRAIATGGAITRTDSSYRGQH